MMPSQGKKSKKLEKYNAYLIQKKEQQKILDTVAYEKAAALVDLPAELSENERKGIFNRMIKKYG